MSVNLNNLQRAVAAWGDDLPDWVKLLASACDRTTQRIAADQLGKSGGYISRLINRNYTGNYSEAEMIIRAKFGAEKMVCPAIGGEIALRTCVKNRRRKALPTNDYLRIWADHCPGCVFNTDREEDL